MPLKPLAEPINGAVPARVVEAVLTCLCPDGEYRRLCVNNNGELSVAATFVPPATQTVNGTVNVGNWPSGFGAVVANWPSGFQAQVTNWPATQPVSGTFWQATQPVSIAAPVAVTGTFWPVTQPVSAAALPLPSGASTEATLALIKAKTDSLDVALSTRAVTGLTDAQLRAAPVQVAGSFSSAQQASISCVSQTANSAAACTLTLPAVVGQFHYLSHLTITRYATAAVTGTATPVIVTSTNLPGNPAWTFARAQAIGTTDTQSLLLAGMPLKSSAANVATTIVCPATTSVLWRVTAMYYAAA